MRLERFTVLDVSFGLSGNLFWRLTRWLVYKLQVNSSQAAISQQNLRLVPHIAASPSHSHPFSLSLLLQAKYLFCSLSLTKSAQPTQQHTIDCFSSALTSSLSVNSFSKSVCFIPVKFKCLHWRIQKSDGGVEGPAGIFQVYVFKC